MLNRQVLMVTIPTGAGLVEGLEAFSFAGLAALGLRASLFDFFWLLAIFVPSSGLVPPRRSSRIGGRMRFNSTAIRGGPHSFERGGEPLP